MLFNRFGTERVTTSMLYSTSRVARIFNPLVFNEDNSKRNRNAKVFKDPEEGKYTQVITLHHQHYEDDDGTLDDAIEDFEPSELSGWIHQARRVRHAIYIGAHGEQRWYPRRNTSGEYADFGRLQRWTGSAWVDVELGTPEITGNTLTWSTTDYDLILEHGWRKNKSSVVLKTETARNKIRWSLGLSGLEWNNWELISASEQVRAGIINDPIAWDAQGTQFYPNVAITKTYSGGYIEYGGDWSAAELPITIDPTFTDGYGGDVTTYKDTLINDDDPTANYGTDTNLHCGETNYLGPGGYTARRRILIQFDLSSIDAGATVTSATLSLYANTDETSNTRTKRVYRLKRVWVEAQATWNIYSTGNNWQTSGGFGTNDCEQTDIGSLSFTASPTLNQYYDWELTTSAISEIIDGDFTNNGFLIKTDTEAEDLVVFTSSDGTAAQRPKLVVEYTEAAGGRTTKNTDPRPLGIFAGISRKVATN